MTEVHDPEPLTRDNAAIAFVDNQVGLMSGIRDHSIADLKHNIVGPAKAAKVLGLPIVKITTSSETLWGPAIPELQKALPDETFIDRTTPAIRSVTSMARWAWTGRSLSAKSVRVQG